MTNIISTHDTAQLLAAVESWATRLGDPGPHFSVSRHSGGWEVTVFVRPIDDPEVRTGAGFQGTYGVIEARADDLDDALATSIRICVAVTRNQAVAS